jgi:Kip1 ubiquitination-promoting complex protein 1
MGVAFKDILSFEPHLAYFPAVSLSQGELCCINLGMQPFQHPVDGFRALVELQQPHLVLQNTRLLTYMASLAVV